MTRSKAEILEELASVSKELRRAEDLSKQRDRLVLEATRADASRSEVGKAAGVSRGRVQQIVTEERKAKMKTQTGLAVIALVIGIGAAAMLASNADNNAGPSIAASAEALTESEIRASDANPQVQWLAVVASRRADRSPFEARTLKSFVCNGISQSDAETVEALLKQPITAESLSSLDETCPDKA